MENFGSGFSYNITGNSTLDRADLNLDDNLLSFDNTDWLIDGTVPSLYDLDLVLDADPCNAGAEAHLPSQSHTPFGLLSDPIEFPHGVSISGGMEDAATIASEQNIGEPGDAHSGPTTSGNGRMEDHPSSFDPSATTPKTSKRFSSTSVRVLNNWLMSHTERPYPTVRDVERLEKLSGLRKQQILSWFSNARRRKKFLLSQPSTLPLDVPRQRPPTPIVEHMNPLERWRNSPPENEPANVGAIARAVFELPIHSDELNNIRSTDSPILQSSENSNSVTSRGTSDSSQGSGTSAYSHSSQDSYNSTGHFKKISKRRRRANARIKSRGFRSLFHARHPFQCTFCTETFKTKHNWQRHEKSLHLSFEQWRCAPYGPTIMDASLEITCVYCGLLNPNDEHLDSHNYHLCQKRQREERTFYRKDHLLQHLRLMHHSTFRRRSMEEWKFDQSPEIRSVCGFCALRLSSWGERADHLAEHFKDGKTMADWKGDWGFEAPVLDMVENSMPPYLIHYEQNSPWPFTTQRRSPRSPTSAFELIQLELDYFIANQIEAYQCIPSNRSLQSEACCIIFGAEILCQSPDPPAQSWLRDLIMSSEEITREARVRPMKSAAKCRLTQLKIHGKENIFEGCQLEALLHKHVDMVQLLDLDIEDGDLQLEACNIINQMSDSSSMFVKLLLELVYSSKSWLAPFRYRAKLNSIEPPPNITDIEGSKELGAQAYPSEVDQQNNIATSKVTAAYSSNSECRLDIAVGSHKVFTLNDSTMYRQLTRELSRFVASTISSHNPSSHVPSDEEIRHQARWIMYDGDDPLDQTPADNPEWLEDFKRDIGI